MFKLFGAALILCAALHAQPADAAPESPVASKDSKTFVLEDLNIYFLRNLGKDGLLDFFQEMALYQEGIAKGLKPSDAETADYISKTMSQDVYNQFKQLYSERALKQLVEYSIVVPRFKRYLRDKIRTEKSLTVTEKEANDYFMSHIKEFHLPEGVYLSIISVSNETQAKAVIDRLKKGENFNAIAGEVNMDPQMRAERGEIGLYRKGDGLPAELEAAAFKLKDGQYTEIPVHGNNYHVLFCHKHYAEVSPTFEDVKEQLQKDMLEAKIDPYYADELNKLMSRELKRFQIQAELFKPDETAAKPDVSKVN
jgi:parvulin-like peptidyl-prolyl isomerase